MIYAYYVKHALYAASQKGYSVISILNTYTLQLCGTSLHDGVKLYYIICYYRSLPGITKASL